MNQMPSGENKAPGWEYLNIPAPEATEAGQPEVGQAQDIVQPEEVLSPNTAAAPVAPVEAPALTQDTAVQSPELISDDTTPENSQPDPQKIQQALNAINQEPNKVEEIAKYQENLTNLAGGL